MPGQHHKHQPREETSFSAHAGTHTQREGEAFLTCAYASIIGREAKETQAAELAVKGSSRQGRQAHMAEPAASGAAPMPCQHQQTRQQVSSKQGLRSPRSPPSPRGPASCAEGLRHKSLIRAHSTSRDRQALGSTTFFPSRT